MNEAKWTNGKTILTGRWQYYWPADSFTIQLDRGNRTFSVKNDTPEWGNYKLIKETNENRSIQNPLGNG